MKSFRNIFFTCIIATFVITPLFAQKISTPSFEDEALYPVLKPFNDGYL